MRIVRFLTLFVLAATLASCVTTTDPRLIAALQRTSVREIRIELAPDVKTFGFGDKPDQQVQEAVRTLQATMAKELIGVPGGPTRGRLVVTLHVFDVTTKQARIIGGHDSMIDGTVRLEDAKTGQLIAEAQNIHGEDLSMRGSGYGVIVAVAINAATTSGAPDIMAQRLSKSFTRNVKTWLTQK
ncbi:hypothetical protein EHI47_12830 [Rhizobium leguminosarum]|jgi:hypothetical protein|uniref:DUF4410 domain-containing protein n=2 Tax=Rhizobium TaxID=379 RepID=A0A444I2C4_RHILE|nr:MULTISPECIES: hypothetical protein [Rhizobium]MBY5458412.1 hypothetical protein [Rhizobium leguminosarum]NKL63763.1 hypothetical protein [Rhizobium leguminosarum bv. viciae]RWX07542.1 hypothetical protein EHI45_25670 [Rhizobium leguminosarum]RWX31520.1 hypothetical protein EHI47_12830 [Rhizobium leguminosarum]TBC66652.1 hypothetical protein ELH27_29075 [Rhizobium leguminosarum]